MSVTGAQVDTRIMGAVSISITWSFPRAKGLHRAKVIKIAQSYGLLTCPRILSAATYISETMDNLSAVEVIKILTKCSRYVNRLSQGANYPRAGRGHGTEQPSPRNYQMRTSVSFGVFAIARVLCSALVNIAPHTVPNFLPISLSLSSPAGSTVSDLFAYRPSPQSFRDTTTQHMRPQFPAGKTAHTTLSPAGLLARPSLLFLSI
ncbi:hypothetical protein PCH_Pc21g15400 [Penicillium rubens Wisconsin 54-1255]|uniref:Uncharacterized protein n=1 Tax=Penicillium rubens (strain ATCC 28089 / DSM 1075 / NRRL 1951 / Wisconsin 54-1255) TaxID=500485 RepID=B6HJI1_PENRW|nr:hypothetical protein PCH_Pc21g15400 [Penicillium rubens Wisconsin 54-1255]